MIYQAIYIIYAFCVGAIFGSFASAIAWRTADKIEDKVKTSEKKKYSILRGRSMCPHCKKTLPWWTLIPIFSYIILRGNCFNCKKHISIVYPLVELLCGAYFASVTYFYLNGNLDLYTAIIFVLVLFILVILSIQDIWFKEISDNIAIPAIIILMISQVIYAFMTNDFGFLQDILLTTCALIIIFGFLVVFTDTMGGGDLRAFALIGLTLGSYNTVLMLTISFLLASIGGIAVVVTKKPVKFLNYHVRLIPYIAVGFSIISLWGNMISKIIFGI